MPKPKNIISSYWKDESSESPELVMREAFLQTVKETFDNFGIEDYSLDQVRGATLMLEKFLQLRDGKL